MKKLSNINESVWADIHKRSNGVKVRKEDEIGNLSKLKPIDMGGTVLWADDDLSLKDEDDCYFTFDEVFELIKNSGWRLPTLEEVAELDDIYKKGSFWENDDRFVFDGFPHQLVFFKKGLIYTSASDKPIDKDYYYCWTSTLFPNNNRFANIFTFSDGKPCHTPLNDQHNVNDSVTQDTTNGKLCVRLVKDKKSNDIDESVWTDIHKRSNGIQVRKEDDINFFDEEKLCDYMNKHYNSISDDFQPFSNSNDFGTIMTSLFKSEDGKYYSIVYRGITSDKPVITFPTCKDSNIENLLSEKYNITYISQYQNKIYYIEPKDGSKITNRIFLEIIDFILDNIEDNFEKIITKK